MPEPATLLFYYGAEGGSAKVYLLADNTVIETGSSGGITGDDDDPVENWERPFNSFDDWWRYFTDRHKEYWIFFYPVFIHEDIKPLIKIEINKYYYPGIDALLQKQTWSDQLI